MIRAPKPISHEFSKRDGEEARRFKASEVSGPKKRTMGGDKKMGVNNNEYQIFRADCCIGFNEL